MEATLPKNASGGSQESIPTHEGKLLMERLSSSNPDVIRSTIFDLSTKLSIFGIDLNRQGKTFLGYQDLLIEYAKLHGLSVDAITTITKHLYSKDLTRIGVLPPSNN